MNIIETIKRIDNLMKKYGADNINSLLDVLEKGVNPQLQLALEQAKRVKKAFDDYKEHSKTKNWFGNLFSQLTKISPDGKLYYITVKEIGDYERASGITPDLLRTGNCFCEEDVAKNVIDELFYTIEENNK